MSKEVKSTGELDVFLCQLFRAFPTVIEPLEKLVDAGSPENIKFHELSVKEHWAGMMVTQRGIEYYLTRVSNIRKTAQYEQYTYAVWNKTIECTEEDNSAIAYKLFCDKWYAWKPVPLI